MNLWFNRRLYLVHHNLFSFIFSNIYKHVSIYITLFKFFNQIIILALNLLYIEISVYTSDSLAKSIGLLDFFDFFVIEFIPNIINIWTNKCVVVAWVQSPPVYEYWVKVIPVFFLLYFWVLVFFILQYNTKL